MSFQVDKCKHFKDGRVCSKCGRMMPAYCKDQQDIEDKARLYDLWVASQEKTEASHDDTVVEPETPKIELVEPEPQVVVAKEREQVVRPKARRGRPRK